MYRRSFLSLAGAAVPPATAANTPRVGLIGSGGRGRLLAAEFKEIGANVGAVCDVYEPNLAAGLKVASEQAKPYTEYRRLLEDSSLEAVIVATPDHWHARMVIDAVQAGKDVYVEKPLCHTIAEGFDVISAVRNTRRVVQVGTQRRSSPLFQEARKLMTQLGDVRLVTSYWLNNQAGLNNKPLEGKLDWKQWQGGASNTDLNATRFFNWYYFWDYSGGLLIGQAAHMVDLIQWFMDSREPVAVTCTGGEVNLKGAEIPETATVAMEFPNNYLATFTIGYKAMRYRSTNDQMAQFHGSAARLDMGREGYSLYPESQELDMKPTVAVRQPGTFNRAVRDHIRNFLECMRTRQDPNATVEMGHATNIVLVMALESLRSGRRVRWNSARRRTET
jgi:predicted dehydrogenase